jgi:hypothetical protein
MNPLFLSLSSLTPLPHIHLSALLLVDYTKQQLRAMGNVTVCMQRLVTTTATNYMTLALCAWFVIGSFVMGFISCDFVGTIVLK